MVWTKQLAEQVRDQEFSDIPDDMSEDDALIEASQYLADAGFVDSGILYLAEKGLISTPAYNPDAPYIAPRYHHPDVL